MRKGDISGYFSISTMFSKAVLFHVHKTQDCLVKGSFQNLFINSLPNDKF